jgi:hypothetical protein
MEFTTPALHGNEKKWVRGWRPGGIRAATSFFDSLRNPPFLMRGLAAEKKKKDLARKHRMIHMM